MSECVSDSGGGEGAFVELTYSVGILMGCSPGPGIAAPQTLTPDTSVFPDEGQALPLFGSSSGIIGSADDRFRRTGAARAAPE
jgi:hypothetical protein